MTSVRHHVFNGVPNDVHNERRLEIRVKVKIVTIGRIHASLLEGGCYLFSHEPYFEQAYKSELDDQLPSINPRLCVSLFPCRALTPIQRSNMRQSLLMWRGTESKRNGEVSAFALSEPQVCVRARCCRNLFVTPRVCTNRAPFLMNLERRVINWSSSSFPTLRSSSARKSFVFTYALRPTFWFLDYYLYTYVFYFPPFVVSQAARRPSKSKQSSGRAHGQSAQ